jgi:hypothetical protein
VRGWETNGKTEKVVETVETQGFAFSVWFSVFFPFSVPFLPFTGACGWSVDVCFPLSFPYPICVERRKSNGKTEKVAETVDTQGFCFSVWFSVCFPFSVPFHGVFSQTLWAGVLSSNPSLIPAPPVLSYRTVCKVRHGGQFSVGQLGCLTLQFGSVR